MIIVWRGFGFLVPLVVLLSVFITSLFPAHADLAGAIALLASGIGIWLLGVRLNQQQPKAHTLFWIPMQYWAIVLGVVGPLMILGTH